MYNNDVRIVSLEEETLLTVAGREIVNHGTAEINSLLSLLKEHSPYTWQHSLNSWAYGIQLGQELNLLQPATIAMGYAFSLHDIGKLLIDGPIVNKSSGLTPREIEIMVQHPSLGEEIIQTHKTLPATFRYVAVQTARGHHEFWNGTGYPDKKAGKEIPFIARANIIVDSYDAMTGERPYNVSAMKPLEALAVMKTLSFRYDPEILGVFNNMIKTALITPAVKLTFGRHIDVSHDKFAM